MSGASTWRESDELGVPRDPELDQDPAGRKTRRDLGYHPGSHKALQIGMENIAKPRTGVGPGSPTPDMIGAQKDDEELASTTDREIITSRTLAPQGGDPDQRMLVLASSSTACQAAPLGLATTSNQHGVKHSSDPRSGPPLPETHGTKGKISSHVCPECEKSYQSRSGLLRHQKECGTNTRTTCQYCMASFPSYRSVRLHELRAHPREYRQDLENKLAVPESQYLAQLANIEAATKKGTPFLKKMAQATGLTEHQIRYRREKPEYSKYLENATKEQKVEAQKIFTIAPEPYAPETLQTKPISPTPGPSTRECTHPLDQACQPDMCNSTDKDGLEVPSSSSKQTRTRETPSISEKDDVRKHRPDIPPSRKQKLMKLPTKDDTDPQPLASSPPKSRSSPSIKKKRKKASPRSKRSVRRRAKQQEQTTQSPNTVTSNTALPTITSNIPNLTSPPKEAPSELSISTSLPDPDPPPADNGDLQFITNLHLAGESLTDPNTAQIIDRALHGTDLELDEAISHWLSAALPARPKKSRAENANFNRPPRPPPPTSNKQKRAAEYKKCQQLFLTKRAMLAKKILDGNEMLEDDVRPSVASVEEYFGAIFEKNSPADPAPFVVEYTPPVHYPITQNELERAINTWKHSAPGTDGITVAQVKACTKEQLLVMFNAVLYRKMTPTRWKESRSILISKGGDKRHPKNWRPITIGSAVQRLLHRILANRLMGAVDLHPLQRGFRNIDGTFANTLLVDHYIKSRKLAGKALNVVSLDVQKAFDSVSHHSIERALQRKGLPTQTISYIMSTLDACTSFQVGHQNTRLIRFNRGVKQGDPLSPLLFNLILDEMISKLNNNPGGGTIAPGVRVSAVGFADDVVLLEDDESQMTLTLRECSQFLESRGMSLNPQKSAAISAATMGGKSVVRSRPIFKVQGIFINAISDFQSFRYLGHQFGEVGCNKPSLFNLITWIRNLQRAPLKPSQKLLIFKQHLVPRMYYGLQTTAITANILTEIDRLLKRSAKRILQLSIHTGDQFLYTAIRNGGLGIPQFRLKIPELLNTRLSSLAQVDDTTASIISTEPTRSSVARIARLVKPGNTDTYWREQMANRPLSAGLEAVEEDVASRDWLLNPPLGWTGRDFVKAVHLRFNNLACRGLPMNPPGQRGCRVGCDRTESLSHILQGCTASHYERIKRHNEIVTKVAKFARGKSWTVEVEPRTRHPDGQLYIPDLAIHRGDLVTICDAQIVWEGPRTLAESWELKRLVYENTRFREAAAHRWPNKQVEIYPLILGARGVWPRANRPLVDSLQLPLHLRRSCVHTCLKWGGTIHRLFMASTWRKRPTTTPRQPPASTPAA